VAHLRLVRCNDALRRRQVVRLDASDWRYWLPYRPRDSHLNVYKSDPEREKEAFGHRRRVADDFRSDLSDLALDDENGAAVNPYDWFGTLPKIDALHLTNR
jgi:hypothetical protein